MSNTTSKNRTLYTKLCGSCKHQSCCTSFASPLLFNTDIERLKSIGKDGEEYTRDILIERQKVRTIRKKANSTMCTFWDENERRCSIYENRPFDCMMYPFDIYLINDKYHWIVYSCNPDSDWRWSEDNLKMFENSTQFVEIMKNIEAFSNLDEVNNLKKLNELPYTVLREVNSKNFKSDLRNCFPIAEHNV